MDQVCKQHDMIATPKLCFLSPSLSLSLSLYIYIYISVYLSIMISLSLNSLTIYWANSSYPWCLPNTVISACSIFHGALSSSPSNGSHIWRRGRFRMNVACTIRQVVWPVRKRRRQVPWDSWHLSLSLSLRNACVVSEAKNTPRSLSLSYQYHSVYIPSWLPLSLPLSTASLLKRLSSSFQTQANRANFVPFAPPLLCSPRLPGGLQVSHSPLAP